MSPLPPTFVPNYEAYIDSLNWKVKKVSHTRVDHTSETVTPNNLTPDSYLIKNYRYQSPQYLVIDKIVINTKIAYNGVVPNISIGHSKDHTALLYFDDMKRIGVYVLEDYFEVPISTQIMIYLADDMSSAGRSVVSIHYSEMS